MKNSDYWGSWKKGPNTTVEEVGRVGCCIVYVGLQTKSVVLGKRLKGAYTTLSEEEGGGEILGISTREKTWDKKIGNGEEGGGKDSCCDAVGPKNNVTFLENWKTSFDHQFALFYEL